MIQSFVTIIIAGLIPVIYYFTAHYFAKRNGTTKHLNEHFPTRVADWLFVPFNISALITIYFSWFDYLIVFLICVIPTIMANNVWKNNFKGRPCVFYKKNILHAVGWTHTIFFLMQLPLVCLFLVLPAQNEWYVLGAVCLLTYHILCLRNQFVDPTLIGYKKPEIPINAIGIILILTRIVLALLGIY